MNTFIQHSQSINLKAAYTNLIEKEIHAFMCSYHRAGQRVYPSQQLLIEMTMSSKSTVQKAIAGLIAKGYIEIQQLGSGRTNTTYRVLVTLEQLEVMHPRMVGFDMKQEEPQTVTEQPVIVSEPVSIPTQPVEVKVEQKASESVTAAPVVSNGIMNLPRRTIPKQVVEQKVEQNELEVLLADKEYIALAAKKKDFSYFDTVTALKAGKFNNQFGIGVNSDFYKQYQAKRAA